MKKRALTLLLSLCFILSLLPTAAFAGSRNYVALGDSITRGYGLNAGENCFAELLADNEYTLTNKAADGDTSADLLNFVEDGANAALLSSADLITITIGGNDLMGALYAYLATAWSQAHPEDPKDADEMKTLLTSGDFSGLSELIGYLPGFGDSSEAIAAISSFGGNLREMIGAIKTVNPNAVILVANQYNPYSYLPTLMGDNPFLAAFSTQIQTLVDAFEDGVTALNQVITSLSSTCGFHVADVYSAFQSAAQNPCNASISLNGMALDLNLDFHPNAHGHALIAEAMGDVLNSLPAGGEDLPEPQVDSLWVNGVNILEADNYTVPCGDGTAVYDAEGNTLTLRNATISEGFSSSNYGNVGIYVNGDLTIVLDGANRISGAVDFGICGDYKTQNLIIKGDGSDDSLTFGDDTNKPGICVNTIYDVEISNCTVEANGEDGGIRAINGKLSIKGSTVTARSETGDWCGLYADSLVVDGNSTVTAVSESESVHGVNATIITVNGKNYVCSGPEMQITNGAAEKGLRSPGVYVNGAFLSGANTSTICGDGTAVYDLDSNTLTLTDAQITNLYVRPYTDYGIYAEDDLNLVLNGSSSVTGDAAYGVFCNGELNISGSGSLSLTIDSESACGIYADCVVIESGSIDATVTDHAAYGSAIWAYSLLSIVGGEVTVRSNVEYLGNLGLIYASYDIAISDGTVTVSFAEDFQGRAMSGHIAISGGTVTVEGGDICSSNGLEVTSTPTIRVTAPDGDPGLNSYGSPVTVNGVEYPYVENDLLIQNGVVMYGMFQTEPKPDDSGGGGGSNTGSSTKTEHTPDGSVITTTTKSDGSSVVRVTGADGSRSVTNIDKNGLSKTEITLSERALTQDGAVALPMSGVRASDALDSAPSVTITLPDDSAVKVEIPVENVTAGTVAVLINDDGTSEIVKTSAVTETGVVLTLSDGETVKLIENSKTFFDVADSFWGADAVAFVSSRALFNGTGDCVFSPNAATSRAMAVTVLARMDGVDTDGGENWYSAGAQWAVSSGISDGSALEQSLTREQLVTMLYRYAQLRGYDVSAGEDTNILSFTDARSISEYAVPAMQWACAVGILQGRGDGLLAPADGATRAEVAAMLLRFVLAL